MQQQLGSLEGVERVELDVQWGLLHRMASVRGQRRMLRRQQQQQQQQQRRSLKQTAAGPTCGDRISYNPDYQVGRSAEGTPYGVSMVSARREQQKQQQRQVPHPRVGLSLPQSMLVDLLPMTRHSFTHATVHRWRLYGNSWPKEHCLCGPLLQVEADTPTMLEISKTHKDNVLFCVIDTGAP
jgi:hypothetical protein